MTHKLEVGIKWCPHCDKCGEILPKDSETVYGILNTCPGCDLEPLIDDIASSLAIKEDKGKKDINFNLEIYTDQERGELFVKGLSMMKLDPDLGAQLQVIMTRKDPDVLKNAISNLILYKGMTMTN